MKKLLVACMLLLASSAWASYTPFPGKAWATDPSPGGPLNTITNFTLTPTNYVYSQKAFTYGGNYLYGMPQPYIVWYAWIHATQEWVYSLPRPGGTDNCVAQYCSVQVTRLDLSPPAIADSIIVSLYGITSGDTLEKIVLRDISSIASPSFIEFRRQLSGVKLAVRGTNKWYALVTLF
jgi:hypothetical protein